MKQNVCSIDYLNASFACILTFLCQAQPVILLLDDIQRADAASAKVLQVWSVDHNFMLILSYCDKEMVHNMRMQKTLKAIEDHRQQAFNDDDP
ncbi:hypothetical protein ACA910_013834 [Epithemia clementina (nom. ined.)]